MDRQGRCFNLFAEAYAVTATNGLTSDAGLVFFR